MINVPIVFHFDLEWQYNVVNFLFNNFLNLINSKMQEQKVMRKIP